MGIASDFPIVNILYGTVTGNAEEIARRVHSKLEDGPLGQGLLRCLADYDDVPAFTKPATAPPAYNVIIVSTTGDGDPPETIRPFMRLIRKKEPKRLEGLKYTVLALGDTNYENFCQAGKKIDNGLLKLGAERFHRRGDADDGVGLELVVEPWLESLQSTLEAIAGNFNSSDGTLDKRSSPTSDSQIATLAQPAEPSPSDQKELVSVVQKITVEELGFKESKLPKVFPPKVSVSVVDGTSSFAPPLSVNPAYNSDIIRLAAVTSAEKLTSPDADKLVWHMEVTCESEGSLKKAYRPGDAFGVIVENCEDEARRFMKTIRADENTVLRLCKESGDEIATAPLSQFVKQRIDLRAVPKKMLLRSISDYCEDVEERKALLLLSSRDGRKKYSEEISKPEVSILHVLEKVAPSCRAPMSLFLDQLPGIAPRWYSATSSPELDGRAVLQFAFSVVENGLATTSLSNLCDQFVAGEPGGQVLLIPRDPDSASYFRPPESLDTSYIMVGPGTGVAPFRGFLRERSASLSSSPEGAENGMTMLFFGCRYREKDFLYKEDLEDLEQAGVLSCLDVAFSRDGPEKVYVQDRLKARGKEVADILGNGGSVFVCGDGGGMAQDVHMALGKILGEFCCGGDMEAGKEMLRSLAEEHRYVKDIWFYG